MSFGNPRFKVILCGEYGAGKSSIFRRFLDDTFTEESGPRSTVGLDNSTKRFETVAGQVDVELWDTCGIERFATMSSSYFQSTKAVILCYSIIDKQSFYALAEHFFRSQVETTNSPALVFICGTKLDLLCDDTEDSVTDDNIKDFKNQCDQTLTEAYQVSSLADHGASVHRMFEDIARHLVVSNQMNRSTHLSERAFHISKQQQESRCCN